MRSPNRKELTRAGILLGCMALAGFLFILAMPLLPGAAQNFLEDAQNEVSGNSVNSDSTAESSVLAAPAIPEPTRRPVNPPQIQGLKPDRPDNTKLFLPACLHSDANLGLVPSAFGRAGPSHGG